MKVKTYGVPGLSEWHGKLKVGSIETKVSFVGGTASPSGSQPAYMTTKDPIVQFVVENSREFKSGFIILLLTQEVAGVHPRMAVPKAAVNKNENQNQNGSQPKSAVSGATAPAAAPAMASQGTEEGAAGAAAGGETAGAAGENQGGEDAGTGEDGGADNGAVDGTAVQTVEVADKKDAIEWLKEKYPEKGYNGNNLRSAAAFEAACTEAGVKFVFTAA